MSATRVATNPAGCTQGLRRAARPRRAYRDINALRPWSADDDRYLWSVLGLLRRTASGSLQSNAAVNQLVAQLAARYKRTDGAIRSRLEHLDDPTHVAYARLHGPVSLSRPSAPPPLAALPRLPAQPELATVGSVVSRLAARRSDLAAALRAYRLGTWRALSLPPYCIFNNKELDAVVHARPRCVAELQRISGFGSAKVGKFGAEIVLICCGGVPPFAADASTKRALPSNFDSPPKVERPPKVARTAASSTHAVAALPVAPPVSAAPISRGALNVEQAEVVDNVLRGENSFLTGAAGVGKSFLLLYLIQELEKRFPGAVAVTASTGIAASHVHGVTIHSFAGIGLGKGGSAALVQKVLGNGAAVDRWTKTRVLVIDEVSMLDSGIFGVLDAIGRAARAAPSLPFGGLQLVLCGDFFQLPPVSLGQYGLGFVFEAAAWRQAGIRTIELKTVVRQSGDLPFIGLLALVRCGVCSEATSAQLAHCHVSLKPAPTDGIVPTKLYCNNRKVDAENAAHLAALAGEVVAFRAADVFKGAPAADVQQRLRESVEKKAVGILHLKLGAQVILSTNMPEQRLVNGSRGVVRAFADAKVQGSTRQVHLQGRHGRYICPVVEFDSGQHLVLHPSSFFQGGQGGAVVRTALPLKLAWALTVHKSRGVTLSRAELHLDDAFEFGQVYVGLSRVTSLAGLWIRGGRIDQRIVKAHPAVVAFYRAVGCSV